MNGSEDVDFLESDLIDCQIMLEHDISVSAVQSAREIDRVSRFGKARQNLRGVYDSIGYAIRGGRIAKLRFNVIGDLVQILQEGRRIAQIIKFETFN